MKTAYELAMERMGGQLAQFTAEQKERLADVDRLYDSKVAALKLEAQRGKRPQGLPEGADPHQVLAAEIAALQTKRERDKAALRAEFGIE